MKREKRTSRASRRRFLKTTSAAATAMVAPYFFTGEKVLVDEAKAQSSNDRPIVGCIGTGSRWGAIGPAAMRFGDCVAVCDVDANHAARAARRVSQTQGKDPEVHEDYRRILDRDDIDVVTIVTPDHWHSKIAIEAMKAGKDIYCEKPLTLTIDEGKKIIEVLKQENRVFQVGTQQRSEMGLRFLRAVALAREGRLGKIRKIECAIGGAPTSGSIPTAEVPSGLNWEMWLGQAPQVDYRHNGARRNAKTRCHYEFRWWYEYSGGKMTDWGAHHVDIAQWLIDQNGEGQGPRTVKPVSVTHPVEFKDGMPTREDEYNTATEFMVECSFDDDVQLVIRHDTRNGLLIEGDKGRIFVGRGSLDGKPVEDLADDPLPEDALTKAYGGKKPGDHMRNFFECVKSRELPVSDVYSHHRAMTTCHLANIAIRLGRELKWDPKSEQIVGDEDANTWQSRPQRKGYEVEA